MIMPLLRSLMRVMLVSAAGFSAAASVSADTDVLAFSQVAVGDRYHTVLLREEQGDTVSVVDLSRYYGEPDSGPLALVAARGFDVLAALAVSAPSESIRNRFGGGGRCRSDPPFYRSEGIPPARA